MIGFPSETKEEIEKTINWACDSKFLIAVFFSVVIYPRQQLMEIAKKVYPNFDFTKWEMFNLRYWVERPFYTRATGIDLFRINYNAYRRFYLNPKRIFLILFRFPKNIFFTGGNGVWRLLCILFIPFSKIDNILFYSQYYKVKKYEHKN